MTLSDDKIWENIECMLTTYRFQHVLDKEHKFIKILNTNYRLVFDTTTVPWRCTVFEFSKRVFSSNILSVVLFLHMKRYKDKEKCTENR